MSDRTPFIRTYWPPNGARIIALAKDGVGSYELPFLVRRTADGKFRNDQTGALIEAQIIGWRYPEKAKAHA
jgi:hypothetical protein